MYHTSNEDTFISNNEAYYTLNVINIETNKIEKIIQKYAPVPYPSYEEIENDFIKGWGTQYKSKTFQILAKELQEYYKNRRFIPSIHHIRVDNNYVFVFRLMKYGGTKGEATIKNGQLVDVFDISEKKFIKTVTFSEVYKVIRNGYAYNFGSDKDGFQIINKYKINPAVYGK
jgi:hypothetical protein